MISVYKKSVMDQIENPLVIIPPIGGSSKTIQYLSNELSKYKNLMVIDLPGHGESVKDLECTHPRCFQSSCFRCNQ